MKKVFRSMFLMILVWKCCLNAMAACVKTIIKTMVFAWFHCFHLFTDLVSCGTDWAHILVSFGDPGDTFSDFGGSWEQVGILMVFSGIHWEAPNPETIQMEGIIPHWGGRRKPDRDHSMHSVLTSCYLQKMQRQSAENYRNLLCGSAEF